MQYSTPCYAWVTALLVGTRREQADLLQGAVSALTASLDELVTGTPADRHGDLFTIFSVLAFDQLKARVSADQRQRWERALRDMHPACAYKDVFTLRNWSVNNWNMVALSGEVARSAAGFGNDSFEKRYLKSQMEYFTPEGLYRDPYLPMAYDLWARFFASLMLQHGYAGEYRTQLDEVLERGAYTSLLMMSPCGELPLGGRSAQHQWNEALECAVFELHAVREHSKGDDVLARAFKRSARIAFQSIERWRRPSGEVQIVKNFFEPELRHGFEVYSFHSQYNLMTAAVLAAAWVFADDSIPEGPTFAETGGFVVTLAEFHKVIANADGCYVELDTNAETFHDSTGLVRIHKSGIEPLVGSSGGCAIRVEPLAFGIAWWDGHAWQPLAGVNGEAQQRRVRVRVHATTPGRVRFEVRYEVALPPVEAIVESYDLSSERVEVTVRVEGNVERLQVRFPIVTSDGRRQSTVTVTGARAVVELGDGVQTFDVVAPEAVMRHEVRSLPVTNGLVDVLLADVPGTSVVYRLTPTRRAAA